LSAKLLPAMSARMLDVLHIIWLTLEDLGVDPAHVNQAWYICQSIKRDKMPLRAGSLKMARLAVHGLRLNSETSVALAPCLLPRGCLWLNAWRRFATGAECLQMQGVQVATLCPGWEQESDPLLKHIAGDAYSLTVVGWYILLAMAAAIPRRSTGCHSQPSLPASLRIVGENPVSLHPRALAVELVNTLEQVWPRVYQDCCRRAHIRLGSLCSGADFVKPFALYIASEVNSRICTVTDCITVVDELACEIQESVWSFRHRCVSGSGPRHFHKDLHKLPWHDLPSVEVLTVSTMCTSLSSQNFDRRSLLDVAPPDHYICIVCNTTRTPRFVI
jgi:hypothetical protein